MAVYLSNKNLLEQLELSHEAGEATNELVNMFSTLTKRIGKKPNFAGYTYNEDMVQDALMACWLGWSKFNMKYKNPFAYFTTICNNQMVRYIKKEHKLRDIRDEIKIANGLDPSWAGQENSLAV